MAKDKIPYRERVAQEMIEQMEKGTAPFQKPWDPGKAPALPFNAATDKTYRGWNSFHLSSKGFNDPRWVTFKQAQNLGARVLKGEKATTVEYWQWSKQVAQKNEDGSLKKDAEGKQVYSNISLSKPKVFYTNIFNAEQVSGLEPYKAPEKTFKPLEHAEKILKETGLTIHHDQRDRAFYRGNTDAIHLPDKEQFKSTYEYYAVALHEVGHATGHKSRFDREFGIFGSEKYAREELRAEMASFMVTTQLGLGHYPERHANYLDSWLKALKDDRNELFKASREAEMASSWILQPENRLELVQQAKFYKSRDFTQTINQNYKQEPQHAKTQIQVPNNMPGQEKTQGKGNIQQSQPQEISKAEQKEKTFIDVPFKEKNAAKALGAKWDKEKQSWYIPENIDASKLTEKWALHDPEKKASQTAKKENQKSAPEKSATPDLSKAEQAQPKQAQSKQVKSQQQKPNQSKTTDHLIFLDVPYKEKEDAKKLGARFNKAEKLWYISSDKDKSQFEKWLPKIENANQIDAVQDFSDTLRQAGFNLQGPPVMDGKWHRTYIDGDKAKTLNGAYIAHLDDRPAGQYKNFKEGVVHSWSFKGPSQELSKAARAQLKHDIDQEKKQHTQAITENQIKAGKKAFAIFKNARTLKEGETHPYLDRKGLSSKGAKVNEKGELLVPFMDKNGRLQNLQTIDAEGSKKFLKGAKIEGGYTPFDRKKQLRNRNIPVIIAEGYSTAGSLAKATGLPVLSVGNAGNIAAVAEEFRQVFPEREMIIAADDDHHLPKRDKPLPNVGLEKATEAAEKTKAILIVPQFNPGEMLKGLTDFNDLHKSRGLAAVKEHFADIKAINQQKGKAFANQKAKENNFRPKKDQNKTNHVSMSM